MRVPKRGVAAFGAVLLLVMVMLAPPVGGTVTPEPVGPSSPVSGAGITPTLWTDNPSCSEVGYGFGFKVDDHPEGTFPFDGTNGGSLTGGAIADPYNSVTITNVSGGITFDWSATLGIDAVIVKAGPEANVYVYSPEAFSDTGLGSPAAPPPAAEISHIEFCYDYEVGVSKTAATTFTRTWEWSIDKSVVPETWDLFTGDSGTSEYLVSVAKIGYTDSDWAVSGSIFVENATPWDATIESVADVVSTAMPADVSCGVTFPYVLAAGETLGCSYGPLALPDGSTRLNTATVITSGVVGGGEGTADVVFGDPTTVVDDEISVSDSYRGSLGYTSGNTSWTYSRTFTCDADEGVHGNTATINETGQTASASVEVDCHALVVTKDADTSFTRTWDWTVDKSADQTYLLLSPGQMFLVNYEVEVSAVYSDSDHAVEGAITVLNPAPIDAELLGVSDIVSPDIVASVDCGVAFPYTLAPGGTLACTYATDLPDAATRTNTATATLQNYAYDAAGGATADGTTGFDGTAEVSFAEPSVTYVDECVDVSDTNVGFLGTVCQSEAPATFSYSMWFEGVECGTTEHPNTASCITNDTGTASSDDWTVTVEVPCATGCTLTPGYWKTHSKYGPAPYDDTWALMGEDTGFFLSGRSYYEVLWTPPRGNAYFILARAYVAAEMNQLNGASIPAGVLAAFDEAAGLFGEYTPDEVAAMRGKSGRQLRAMFIELAGILDGYNNGLTGPGHCSE